MARSIAACNGLSSKTSSSSFSCATSFSSSVLPVSVAFDEVSFGGFVVGEEAEGAGVGVVEEEGCLGRKAPLMSPVPTKNSSVQPNDDNNQIPERKKRMRGRKDVQGTTLMRFLAELHTSDRSSMMTTIELSTGNSLSILFCVRPTQQEQYRWSVPTYCARHGQS